MSLLGNIFNIFVFLTTVTNGFTYNTMLTRDYIASNYIKTLLFIICESKNELFSTDTMKHLQNNGIWTNVWDISNESIWTNFDNYRFFDRFGHPPSVVINLECNQTSSFMTQISKRMLFHNERNWLMLSGSLTDAVDILFGSNINFDADIFLTIPATRKQYEIYEVFNPSYNRGGRLNVTQVGNWNQEIGWDISLKQTKIERRHDLNGITFPAVIPLANIPINKTFLEHLNSNELVHLDSMTRFMYNLFVLMMEMYNFKVNLRLANLWGLKDSTGIWHGAVGALNRSQVDFCITGLRWANERYGVFEQTTPAYHAQFLFIFRHPKFVESWNIFLSPFTSQLWLAGLGLCVLSVFIARQIFSIEILTKIKNTKNEHSNDDNSYSNSLLMVFGFIFQQSYSGNPAMASSRVLIISLLMYSVLIFQFYSSFIVGSLLTVAPKNIKTVKQLLHSRFEFGVDIVPYVLDNFHSATEESTVKLYDKIMQNPGKALMPLVSGLNLLKTGGFVFNTDGSYAYHVLKHMLTDSEKCDLQDIAYLQKQPVGLGVANKSPFRELVKISVRKFTENGLLSYKKNIWYGVRPKCEVNELFVRPVDIVHFASALYILTAGILISIMICMFEVIVHHTVKLKLPFNSDK